MSKAVKKKISGIFLLDKPLGLSSNQALQQVKRAFQAEKAGHTGSLDVLASGMLPICFGEATKFSQYMLDADKVYFTKAKLGERTTTCDAEGEVIERKSVNVTLDQLQQVLQQFLGETKQIPSMYSALKHEGKPLYQYARQGIEIDRKERSIFIEELKLIDFSNGYFSLEVRCSKGTYIRNLVDDIGQHLGCGAYVAELRRLRVANFLEKQMTTLEQVKSLAEKGDENTLLGLLVPIDSVLQYLEIIMLEDEQIVKLRQGQFIAPSSEFNLQHGYHYRVYHKLSQQFCGLVKFDDDKIKPEKMIFI